MPEEISAGMKSDFVLSDEMPASAGIFMADIMVIHDAATPGPPPSAAAT